MHADPKAFLTVLAAFTVLAMPCVGLAAGGKGDDQNRVDSATPVPTPVPADPVDSSGQEVAPDEILVWFSIRSSEDPAVYQQFLDRFPNGTFANLARIRRDALTDGAAGPVSDLAVDTAVELPTFLLPGDEMAAPVADPDPTPDTSAPDPRVRACDLAAGHPRDGQALPDVAGVEFGDINTANAVTACVLAHELFPANARISFNLARAYHAANAAQLAERFYLEAAAGGHIRANAGLGFLYDADNALDRDASDAMPYLRLAAEAGAHDVAVDIGWNYYSGDGVAQDQAEAVRWFRIAADAGVGRGFNALGVALRDGEGVTQDPVASAQMFRQAGELGYARSWVSLGHQYEIGLGVAQSDRQAVRYYQMAADLDDAMGITNLGWMYANGRGVAQDPAQAIVLYQRAADQDFSRAINLLGGAYEDGKGVAQDYVQAAMWYQRGANLEDARSQNDLGLMYAQGRGVEQNKFQAARYFMLAAVQGYQWAQFNYAQALQSGTGVEQDLAKARHWYGQAAGQGHSTAMYELGWMDAKAQAGPKDLAKALAWFDAAREAGHTRSWASVAFLYETEPTMHAPDMAAQYYIKALQAGDDWPATRPGRDWDRDTARALQRWLQNAGVYRGAIDGSVGPATQAAMRRLLP